MATTIGGALQRAHYGAAQTARIAWYTAHYVLGRRVLRAGSENAGPRTRLTAAERRRLAETFRGVFRDEWASIERGEYKLPAELRRPPSIGAALAASRDYMRDAREVAQRKARHGHSEVLDDQARAAYPRYYLQNFHYQSGGWLSAESAARYDMQVETLFTGAADVMRRCALPAIGRAIAGRDPSTLRLLDLGCGAGSFLHAVKDNWPALRVAALDLSPAYLGKARTRLGAMSGVEFRQAAAEATGYPDAAFDIVTSVYLFHELPPATRVAVAAEISRLLRPSGVYVHADTLQYGDEPLLDRLLAAFPKAVHEPYYDSYCRELLNALFGGQGLSRAEGDALAFLTKISVYGKPA